jgi:hypothetical protein
MAEGRQPSAICLSLGLGLRLGWPLVVSRQQSAI